MRNTTLNFTLTHQQSLMRSLVGVYGVRSTGKTVCLIPMSIERAKRPLPWPKVRTFEAMQRRTFRVE